jgi:hypothetical protein
MHIKAIPAIRIAGVPFAATILARTLALLPLPIGCLT